MSYVYVYVYVSLAGTGMSYKSLGRGLGRLRMFLIIYLIFLTVLGSKINYKNEKLQKSGCMFLVIDCFLSQRFLGRCLALAHKMLVKICYRIHTCNPHDFEKSRNPQTRKLKPSTKFQCLFMEGSIV